MLRAFHFSVLYIIPLHIQSSEQKILDETNSPFQLSTSLQQVLYFGKLCSSNIRYLDNLLPSLWIKSYVENGIISEKRRTVNITFSGWLKNAFTRYDHGPNIGFCDNNCTWTSGFLISDSVTAAASEEPLRGRKLLVVEALPLAP